MKSSDALNHSMTAVKALSGKAPAVKTGSKATVPVDNTAMLFDFTTPVALANYPEPGMNSTYTITPADAPNNVYRIDVTTTFPSMDPVSTYVESYYVQDVATIGTWDINDPIVKGSAGSWTVDENARIQQLVNFKDGTKRYETSLADSNADGAKYAAFDINGSLDFGAVYYPATTSDPTCTYSSVTSYYDTESDTPSYWFWNGKQAKTVLGVRFYTEFKDATAGTLTSYTILFEKAVMENTTLGGSFASSLKDVFLNSNHTVLAQTVLRQKTVYTLDGSGNPIYSGAVKTTKMQAVVANIAGQKDFYIGRLNNDSATLTAVGNSTFYAPADDAEQIIASTPSAKVYTALTTVDGLSIPIVKLDSTPSDLSTLYASLLAGAVSRFVAPASNIDTGTPGLVDATGNVFIFNGTTQGTVFSPASNYILGNDGSGRGMRGTVEAWVYIPAGGYVNTAGIVHQGIQPDFSDEGYSLQFWDAAGTLVFSVSQQSPYQYDMVTARKKLTAGVWHYLVGVWDCAPATGSSYVKIYVDGALSASKSPMTMAANGTSSNVGPLVIGSQLIVPTGSSALSNYYSFKGSINGVRAYSTPASASDVSSFYSAYKGLTAYWPTN